MTLDPPDGYEWAYVIPRDRYGRTCSEVLEDFRKRFWRPMRRAWLEDGLTLDMYYELREAYRRMAVTFVTRWTSNGVVAVLRPKGPRAPQ